MMKITEIETIRSPDHLNLVWVHVKTDEGLTGLGETWFGAAAVESDIHVRIAPLIIGQDPSRIGHLHRLMTPYVGFCGTGAEMRALSAVDVALWDLAGKVANQPICQLLGGKTRNGIPVYNTCAGPDYVSKRDDVHPDNFGLGDSHADGWRHEDLDAFMNRPAELAAELMEMDIYSMKIWPFDFSDGAAEGIDISVSDIKKSLQPFELIRKQHGDKIAIKAELHGLWSLPAAVKISDALAPIGCDWLEDPVWMDRFTELAAFSAAASAPVAGGETLGGLGQIRDLIEVGQVDTPIIDVTWGGGITFARKSAAVAETNGRPIAFHDCSGPVTLAASTHLALHCPNVTEQEMARAFYYGWYGDLVDERPPLNKGRISVSDRPGLGLSLSEKLLASDDLQVRRSVG